MEPLQNPWPTTSWGPDSPPQPESQERPRTRSSTAPDGYHPALLTVAHPAAAASARSSIHNPDLFFMDAQASEIPPALPTAPIPPRRSYPEDYATPGLRRVRTAPPPVPPHPYTYASTPNTPPLPSKPLMDSVPPRPPRPTSEPSLNPPSVSEEPEPEPAQTIQEDDAELAELAAVLALSQAETLRQEKLQQKMLSQEEADLARAMEASMAMSSWSNSYSSALGVHTTVAGSSSTAGDLSTAETPRLDYMDDAAFARMLAAQEQDEPTPTQTSFSVNGTSSPNAGEQPLDDPGPDANDLPVYSPRRVDQDGRPLPSTDEDLARQFAAEEEVLARESKEEEPQDPLDLPTYSDGKIPPPIDVRTPELLDLARVKSAGQELTWVDTSLESPILLIEAQRPASVDATNFRSPSGLLYPPENVRSAASSASIRSEDSYASSIGANQFIDTDLLRGVSIGFVAPSITPDLVPLAGSMPNIISLPYGRCPPLHLQAPSWRHLLKLMARLSGTRIEPTVEALAVTRSSQMHLRTVVQFVRPHHTSPEWRTVLWFTIDHPVPTSLPGARKYTNGDVDVLPWSYTLSSIPALLRDGSDTLLSKCYTIPSSDAVPFPALPISFPNMAMYLQAALEESRRYSNDSSSGVRKLAKMVETCYPSYSENGGDDGERSRVGGLFKKVIGRGGRKDKSKKGKGGNEDTYELVTPFVLDDFA
ncbi:hypothetical protein C8R43DRAFT_972430 [Mycena crocata]|nr:hypothetical protein C8R43DRAFT_972430 [Mycena crocata]